MVYADVKRPLSSGSALRTVGRYAVAKLQEAGVDFSAVGGLTMGAAFLVAAAKSFCATALLPEPDGPRNMISFAEE